MTDFDIVLPVHKKDIDIIEICLKYLRKNVNNNCNIYIISKNKLTDNAIWIQENIFPFSFNDISNIIGNHFRTGWYYASLLKLHWFLINGIKNNVLVCDIDTIFIKKTCFFENNKALFNISPNDGTPMYNEHMMKLLNIKSQLKNNWSGITHHIMMNKQILLSLIEYVKKKNNNNQPFWKINLLKTCEKYKTYPVLPSCKNLKYKHMGPGRWSTYELYCQYALKYFPDKVKIRKLNSIMAYKGFLNVKNCNFRPSYPSRTNLQGNVIIISPEKEKEHVFDNLNDCLEFHIEECIKKNFDSVTFQNHSREGSGIVTHNSSGDKR